MVSTVPDRKDLLLIGGGHSHVTVLKRFGMQPEPGVRLTLVSRDVHAPYSGMLPGLIAGHYDFDQAHIDLEPLARFAGARFLHDEVVGLDLDAHQVNCGGRPPLSFDVLSINAGSAPRMRGVRGAADAVVPVKPIDGFSAHWRSMRERLLRRTEPTTVAVVGGGAGGVELLLSVQHRLRQDLAAVGRDGSYLTFRLYTAAAQVLPTHNRGVQRRFARVLGNREVEVYTGHRVAAVERGDGVCLRFESGSPARVDEVLWVTTAGAQTWPEEAGLEVDGRGFIRVRDTLQSCTDDDIFAAGDIASMVNHPRPKAGVFAVRHGPPLEHNLRRRLRGQQLRPYRPQRAFLSLVSTGDRYAVASRSFWSLEGGWVWRWKDWIDRRFMARYNELPEMVAAPAGAGPEPDAADPLAAISKPAMRCGGCGSKVGSDLLARALARLPRTTRPEVLVGLDAPDDAALVEVPAGKVMVQTVDHFRAFVDDPFVFGQVTANHALGDIWAMGAEPLTALAVVTVPLAAERQMEEDIFQLLAGAQKVLAAAGAVLVGGHTTEGSEMALGFAVNGLVEPQRAVRKLGLRPGDALLLTKPVGTGALFAAAMRGRAKGRWIAAAIETMLQSSRDAAHILLRHGARAMTDVTGFGLLGHLVEMLTASGVGATLELPAVPLLPGALRVTGAGITSSLQPDNLRLRRAVTNLSAVAQAPAYPLLFDPQTAGGLLAGVPPEAAPQALAQLQAGGYLTAARIGTVVAGGALVEIVGGAAAESHERPRRVGDGSG